MTLMSTSVREREDDDSDSRSAKRTKTTESDDDRDAGKSSRAVHESDGPAERILPPSHVLLGPSSPQTTSDGLRQLLECDVGISEYITRDISPISGIIKQR